MHLVRKEFRVCLPALFRASEDKSNPDYGGHFLITSPIRPIALSGFQMVPGSVTEMLRTGCRRFTLSVRKTWTMLPVFCLRFRKVPGFVTEMLRDGIVLAFRCLIRKAKRLTSFAPRGRGAREVNQCTAPGRRGYEETCIERIGSSRIQHDTKSYESINYIRKRGMDGCP